MRLLIRLVTIAIATELLLIGGYWEKVRLERKENRWLDG